MSIETNGRERTLACDECQDVFGTYHHDDFHSMLADAKDAGWTVRSTRTGWTHHCPDCRPETALEAAQRMFR